MGGKVTVLKAMNSEVTRLTGKKAKEIRQRRQIYKRTVGLDEVRLPPGVEVRYLMFWVKARVVKNVVQQIRYGV